MRTVKKSYLLAVVMIMHNALAFASSDDETHTLLVKDGLLYEYERLPFHDDSGTLMYYGGKISVSNSKGDVLLVDRYAQSPGCAPDLPPISVIHVPSSAYPLAAKKHKRPFIVFCGSHEGKHKTLRFYDPHVGFISAIDFFTGPVYVREYSLDGGDAGSKVMFVVTPDEYFTSINRKVYYPIVYELNATGLGLEWSLDTSTAAAEIYREWLTRYRETDNDDASLIRGLIVQALLGDTLRYCELLQGVSREKSGTIQGDLQEKISKVSIPSCKEHS